MRILITGATGFIGKNLAKRLLAKDHEIFCIVRKTSKFAFLEQAGIQLFFGDITKKDEINEIFQKTLPEVVFHCAADITVKDEVDFKKTNVEGTRNIVQACYGYHVSRLIYLSSIAVVIGNNEVLLTDDLPYKATTLYGRSKSDAERIVLDFREKGLNAAIIRPCLVYGEGEQRVFKKILKLIKLHCMPLFNVPDINHRMPLVYVENLVSALLLALEKNEALNGTFIVADKDVVTFRKVFEVLYDEIRESLPLVIPAPVAKLFMVLPFFKKKINIVFQDKVCDISRAESLLGYDPEVSTEEGLRRMVQFWKDEK